MCILLWLLSLVHDVGVQHEIAIRTRYINVYKHALQLDVWSMGSKAFFQVYILIFIIHSTIYNIIQVFLGSFCLEIVLQTCCIFSIFCNVCIQVFVSRKNNSVHFILKVSQSVSIH